MTRRQVIDLLEFYPCIGEEIKIYTNILRDCEGDWGVDAQQLDGMPRGSGTPDPTARDGYLMAVTGAGDYMREVEAQISRLQILQKEIFREFKRLPYYQKMMIYYYYLDGKRWVWIANKLSYSERQCRNMRDAAINALCKAFEENAGINPVDENYRRTG